MKYHIAETCQNTFILFDCLNSRIENLHHVQQCLKNENRDDALILTEGKFVNNSLYSKMLVVGLDGTLGEFCGNGSLACAAYLFENYPHIEKLFLKTHLGIHPLNKLENGIYSIKLPHPRYELNPKFIKSSEYTYVEMIEPHLVIKQNMSDEDLLALGRELNHRKDIYPLGINVNAWHILFDGSLFVKTYERGVQRLTKSCGTGSLSCAATYKTSGSVLVTTPGGILNVTLDIENIELKGPASIRPWPL